MHLTDKVNTRFKVQTGILILCQSRQSYISACLMAWLSGFGAIFHVNII